MRDNLRRYRAIREALKQGYPDEPKGRMADHLTPLAAFISGMVGSKSSQLPRIATKVPERAKPDSRVKRLSRWLDNDAILEEVYFLPHAERLRHQLALETLVLVMDGSWRGPGVVCADNVGATAYNTAIIIGYNQKAGGIHVSCSGTGPCQKPPELRPVSVLLLHGGGDASKVESNEARKRTCHQWQDNP